MQNQIDRVDKLSEKLDKMSEKIKVKKADRTSVKGKLIQMKEKVEQQTKEPNEVGEYTSDISSQEDKNQEGRESIKDKLGKNKEAVERNSSEKKESEHKREEAR